MSSIVSFEERYTDVILKSLNGMHERKLKGIIQPDELSKELILVGDLGANKIKQGKMSEDEKESFVALFPEENYFSNDHKDIPNAYKTAVESIEMADEYSEQRNMNQTVESYTKRRVI